jgi:hypothetical protein
MKRDLDLLRRVLLHIERGEFDPSEGALQFARADLPESLSDEHTPAEVLRHIELLWEAGLVDVYIPEGRDDIPRTEEGIATSILVCGSTHEGHEFIGHTREDRTWEQAKEKAESTALDVLKDTAEAVVTGSL